MKSEQQIRELYYWIKDEYEAALLHNFDSEKLKTEKELLEWVLRD